MDRQLFDEAIGHVPVSTVDVDAVIARQRRAARLRRVGGPGLVAVLAVVVVTVGVALVVPGRDRSTAGNTSGGTGSPPATSPADESGREPLPTGAYPPPGAPGSACEPPADLPAIPGDPADIAGRLRLALEAAVRAQLPDAQLSASPVHQYQGRHYGALEFMHVDEASRDYGNGSCQAGEDYYLARATITDANGGGNLLAYLGRAADATDAQMQCSAPGAVRPEETFCEQRTGPGGEAITVTTLVLEGGSSMHRVDVVKPDATMVTVSSENVSSSGKAGGPAERPAPPLTHGQLLAIALTPALTLFP